MQPSQQSGLTGYDAASFADLARRLHSDLDHAVTAETVVRALAAALPEADAVSITVRVRRGRYRTLAATDELAERADALQYDLDEGPCVIAARDNPWLRSDELATDDRWPRWGSAAARLGVGSSLAVQLLDQDQPSGALNLYSRTPGAFSGEDVVDVVLVYAIHAANALNAAHEATHLQTALHSRHAIGIAQGILMERYGLDEQRSFEYLSRLSSQHETKIRDVAAAVVDSARREPGGD